MLYETWPSSWYISQISGFSFLYKCVWINDMVFFFEVGCIISTKYLDEPYGTVPILTLWLPSGRFIPAYELL